MNAREAEGDMLARCAAVARGSMSVAHDQREANVFRLAAMVVQSRFPRESASLMQASERYFERYPNDKLVAADVVRGVKINRLLIDECNHYLRAFLHGADKLHLAR